MPNFDQEGPSQEEIGIKPEIKRGRPTEEDFKKRVENYISPLENGSSAMFYYETKMELENLAKGKGDQELREQYYPDWEDEDFQEVVKRLNEKEKEIMNKR